MSYPLVEAAFNEFGEVGRLAVLVELKIRLLTNKITHLQDYAFSHSLSGTEAALLPYLLENKLISEEEKSHLELSRKIRNKIFHCEFEEAVKFIEELRGEKMQSGSVIGAKIDELEGDNILEKIIGLAGAIQSGKAAKGAFKIESKTTKFAGIFGWLIEAQTKELLVESQKIASQALSIIERVFETLAKQDFENARKSEY